MHRSVAHGRSSGWRRRGLDRVLRSRPARTHGPRPAEIREADGWHPRQIHGPVARSTSPWRRQYSRPPQHRQGHGGVRSRSSLGIAPEPLLDRRAAPCASLRIRCCVSSTAATRSVNGSSASSTMERRAWPRRSGWVPLTAPPPPPPPGPRERPAGGLPRFLPVLGLRSRAQVQSHSLPPLGGEEG